MTIQIKILYFGVLRAKCGFIPKIEKFKEKYKKSDVRRKSAKIICVCLKTKEK